MGALDRTTRGTCTRIRFSQPIRPTPGGEEGAEGRAGAPPSASPPWLRAARSARERAGGGGGATPASARREGFCRGGCCGGGGCGGAAGAGARGTDNPPGSCYEAWRVCDLRAPRSAGFFRPGQPRGGVVRELRGGDAGQLQPSGCLCLPREVTSLHQRARHSRRA